MNLILKFPDEERDITDICSGYIEKADGVSVSYSKCLVNGEQIPFVHQVFHAGARVVVREM